MTSKSLIRRSMLALLTVSSAVVVAGCNPNTKYAQESSQSKNPQQDQSAQDQSAKQQPGVAASPGMQPQNQMGAPSEQDQNVQQQPDQAAPTEKNAQQQQYGSGIGGNPQQQQDSNR